MGKVLKGYARPGRPRKGEVPTLPIAPPKPRRVPMTKAEIRAYKVRWQKGYIKRIRVQRPERYAYLLKYRREWQMRWRKSHPEKYAKQQAQWKINAQYKRKYGPPKGKYVEEEDMTGHCKRCGILLTERGTPDNVHCTPCARVINSKA